MAGGAACPLLAPKYGGTSRPTAQWMREKQEESMINRPTLLWHICNICWTAAGGGEVHGVGNCALPHGAGGSGIGRDRGRSVSRAGPGQGAGEVEAESSRQGRSRGRSDG